VPTTGPQAISVSGSSSGHGEWPRSILGGRLRPVPITEFPRTGRPKGVRHVGAFVGYARVSTDQQDLTSQRDGHAALGVVANRIYVDNGLTGTNRERPGLREALAACR